MVVFELSLKFSWATVNVISTVRSINKDLEEVFGPVSS